MSVTTAFQVTHDFFFSVGNEIVIIGLNILCEKEARYFVEVYTEVTGSFSIIIIRRGTRSRSCYRSQNQLTLFLSGKCGLIYLSCLLLIFIGMPQWTVRFLQDNLIFERIFGIPW